MQILVLVLFSLTIQISPTACNFSNTEVSQEGDAMVCEILTSRRLLWIPMKNSLNFGIQYFKFKLTAGTFFNLNVFFSTCLYYMLCFTHIGSLKFQIRIQLRINPSVRSWSFETLYFYAAYFMNLINLLISTLNFTYERSHYGYLLLNMECPVIGSLGQTVHRSMLLSSFSA